MNAYMVSCTVLRGADLQATQTHSTFYFRLETDNSRNSSELYPQYVLQPETEGSGLTIIMLERYVQP